MLRSFLWWLAVIGIATAGVVAFGAENKSKPVLENHRVRVTRIDLTKDATIPTDTRYEAVTVQVGKGETQLLDPQQLAKTEPQGVGQVHFFVPRSKRSVKSAGNTAVPMVLVQFLRPVGKYVAFDVPATHYCNSGSSKACVTERYMFCTDRFCAENVTMEPGAISTYHLHTDDYLIVATSDFTWRDEVVNEAPQDIDFKAGDVKYMKAGARHRLTNTGNGTAAVFVIQFK
jgi:quercetin dioxygenase-like cupin family protein